MKATIEEDITPRRQTYGSAGYDFYAPKDIKVTWWKWTRFDAEVVLEDSDVPQLEMSIPAPELGEHIAISRGGNVHNWVMLLVPRSGLGTKYKMRFANTIGVIDKDYRGHISFMMKTSRPYTIKKGERFAQGIIIPYLVLYGEIPPTKSRGEGGHGSTGN